MCPEIRRVHHDRFVFGAFGGQAYHDPGEDAMYVASLGLMAFNRSPPAFPAIVEGLRGAVLLRRVEPP